MSGFGLGLLVSQGFLGAKAGHSDQRFCRWKLLFYQQPCAKAKEFGFRRILGLFAGFFMEESCRGFFVSNWLCSKPGRFLCERIKLTFTIAPGCLHSLRSVDMTVLAAFATLVCQRNCVFLCKGTKLKNSACAEFLG